jgi:hypothetical protein
MPSTAAAREMLPPHRVRTVCMCVRIASSSEVAPVAGAGGGAAGATDARASGRSRVTAVTLVDPAIKAARSMTLASSRTLPGHA